MSVLQTFKAVSLAIAATLMADCALAQPIQIVTPNAYEFVEGELDSSVGNLGGFNYQQIFPAADFDALPPTGGWITAGYFRPGESVDQSGSATYDDLIVKLSTTTKEPDELTLDFATNHGDDVMTVLNGPAVISTNNQGPDEGPKVFDYKFVYEPFYYDPGQGNLLLEATSSSGAIGEAIFDAFQSSSPQIVNGLSGQISDAGFVMQLEFVPEPSAPSVGCICGWGAFWH